MTISLVRIGGVLVGRTAEDRWNLESLGYLALPYERNQSALKRLRRAWPEFRIVAVRGCVVADSLAFQGVAA